MTTLTPRLFFAVSDADMQVIRDAVKVLQDKLVPHLVDLGPTQRRDLPKMGDKTVSFVSKALDYAQANPALRASYIDIDTFARDFAAVEQLLGLHRPLSQVIDMVSDSLMLKGSEAYNAALACYEVAKGAAKRNIPGAATVADDLRQRFPQRGPRPREEDKGDAGEAGPRDVDGAA